MLNNTSSTTNQNLDLYDPFEVPDDPFARFVEETMFNGCCRGYEAHEWVNSPEAGLDAALSLRAKYDWKLFPARMEVTQTGSTKKYSWLSKEHAPGGENWGQTKDPEQLRQNFSNPRWRDKCGVGLPTGADNGIFIVEYDTIVGHGVDGLANLSALEDKHGKLPKTLMAKSPTDSVHRYFKHPGGIRLKSMSIAAGVDVKADNGMVVVPPSVRHDGRYKWLNDEEIAEAPAWLIELVCNDASNKGGEKDPFEQSADEMRGKIPLDKLTFMLMKVIPNTVEKGRAHWIKVGHALKYERPGDDGLQLFLQFSQKWDGTLDQKYVDDPQLYEKSIAETWRGLNPTRISGGSIYWLANEADPDWRDKYKPTSNGERATRLMQTSAEFVAGYVPPDYLIDGLLQRRYVYSFTGPTGSGKTAIALRIAVHVARGLPLARKEVEKGRVLFFAGENPDDVRSRWIKLCEEMSEDPDTMDVVFMPFTLNLAETREKIDAEAAEHGPFVLLIVDTSAAYYTGDDENDNVALGNHARMLRTFIKLPGGPTILVTCHPTKTPNMENLLPRGGGAFLAEVDGNLVCVKDAATMVVEVTTHGKFRGPDFAPFSFKLVPGKSEKLVDSKGREIWSIFARPISKEEQEVIEKAGHSDQDKVLRAMLDQPGRSLLELAEHLWWRTNQGELNKQKVHRVMKDLHKAKLVEMRRDGHYVLTKPKGEEEAAKTPEDEVGDPKKKGIDPFEEFANEHGTKKKGMRF